MQLRPHAELIFTELVLRAILPWMHRFDMRIVQDLKIHAGIGSYKLQGFLDVLNLGNMISSRWGAAETKVQNNLMNFEGPDGAGNGMFTLNTVPATGEFPVTTFRPVAETIQAWSAQIGLRLSFN